VASEALKEADIETWDCVRRAEIGRFGRHCESRGLCLGRKRVAKIAYSQVYGME
jgi:hypothetical protein